MIVRLEHPADIAAVYAVNAAAFPTVAEADLVDVLRVEASPFLSFVAEVADSVVGHILFTAVTLTPFPTEEGERHEQPQLPRQGAEVTVDEVRHSSLNPSLTGGGARVAVDAESPSSAPQLILDDQRPVARGRDRVEAVTPGIEQSEPRLLGLGPLAVLPTYQRQGIGSALVHHGLDRCRELGYSTVVVLGHPSYYPRFGFTRASDHGIRCEFDGTDEAFMVLEFQPGRLWEGTIHYHPAFASV